MKPRVLICDPLEAEGLSILEANGIEVDNRPGLKREELLLALRQSSGAIVRSGTKLTAEHFENPGKLRVVVRAGVGVDNIAVAAATRRGVIVMNTPGGNTYSTCEQTWALILSMVRKLPAAEQSMRAGEWNRGKFIGTQLAGKTLGIIGLGRIGKEVAKRALAMDMKVIGYDPVLPAEQITKLGFQPSPDIAGVVKESDILTLHTPLTDETRHMISSKELAMMKPGSRVVNCARGGLIDEMALLAALDAGQIAEAALDVFETEPLPSDHPLRKHPKVLLTPHLGASTSEAQRNVAIEAAELISEYLMRGQVAAAVNMAAIDQSTLQQLRPYLDAAHRLGLLLAQIHTGSLRSVSLSFRGEIPEKGTRLLTAAFVTGLLETRLDESVNPVNAILLAQERGIEVTDSRTPATGDFGTLLHAQIETDIGSHEAAATLFGKQYLRLVQFEQFNLDGYLDGHLLLFTHRDLPGLIGFIGTVFGTHKINIAQMAVGRKQMGGDAVGVLNLDSCPPEEALAEVQTNPHIQTMHYVKLPDAGVLPVWC